MKRNIVMLLGIVAISFSVKAGGNKIYDGTKEVRKASWYLTQTRLWVDELEINPYDEAAWMNCFMASKMAQQMGWDNQVAINQIVRKVDDYIPNTFTSNFILFAGSSNKEQNFDYLVKARNIDPNRVELYPELMAKYELERDKVALEQLAAEWFEGNHISPDILAWNYNMLAATEENALLFTYGDHDTYPAWVIQNAKGLRRDVAVINMRMLLNNEAYLMKYFEELNIPAYKIKGGSSEKDNYKNLLRHVYEHTAKPIFFSPGAASHLDASFEDELYIVGLAFKWTKDSFDNIAVLRKNYEKNMLKDHLKISFYKDEEESLVSELNSNYLYAFITLHNHYKEAEETSKQSDLHQIIDNIAKKSGKSDEVNVLLNSNVENVVSKMIEDPRVLTKGFLKVRDNLFVAQNELTNENYELFLMDLLKMKRFDELAVAKVYPVDWKSLLPADKQHFTMDEMFRHGKPDDANVPVVNISFEAAKAYCDWMTIVYNKLPHKKKDFKKVLFRLPTEEEWEFAAKGGTNRSDFYWGEKPTNSKGCFLSNFNTGFRTDIPVDPNACPTHDGGVFMVHTASYHPNNYEIYNILGNVAEMIDQKGITKGGGWNTLPEKSYISERQTYAGHDPNVGVRIFMEIIEK